VREHETEQRAIARDVPGVREHETELRAEARQDPEVRARESRQRAVARGKKTYVMACKCVNGDCQQKVVMANIRLFLEVRTCNHKSGSCMMMIEFLHQSSPKRTRSTPW
jgi:tryptophanase